MVVNMETVIEHIRNVMSNILVNPRKVKEIPTLERNSFIMKSTKSSDESDACMRQRLLTSLSQSFPGSALSKALRCMTSDSEDEDMKIDPLSHSCFAELRLEKEDIDEDDDLTSLAWLQDRDLLKNIKAGEDEENEQKENGDISRGNSYPFHPTNVPYNPHKHVNSKPPYSFSCLIFMAIEDSPVKKLPVKDIYSWILTHFPYFQNAPTGWKNSVRHNLSLNKCFKKVEKERGQCIGKGSLWCIDPDYRPNLLQALRKTPYHPYHQLQMLATPTSSHQYYFQPGSLLKPMPLSARVGANSVSPHLFPFLSKRLSQSTFDFDDIKDVAQTLVSLKGLSGNSNRFSNVNGSPADFARMRLKRKYGSAFYPMYRRRPPVDMVCTSNPSKDHTYSATTIEDFPPSPSSSIDEEYDFGSENVESDQESFHSNDWESECDEVDGYEQLVPVNKITKLSQEDEAEEQKKIADGADALLNLAGMKFNPP